MHEGTTVTWEGEEGESSCPYCETLRTEAQDFNLLQTMEKEMLAVKGDLRRLRTQVKHPKEKGLVHIKASIMTHDRAWHAAAALGKEGLDSARAPTTMLDLVGESVMKDAIKGFLAEKEQHEHQEPS
jgi:hypothetical protein